MFFYRHTTLEKVTSFTQIYYDPDAQATVVGRDEEYFFDTKFHQILRSKRFRAHILHLFHVYVVTTK